MKKLLLTVGSLGFAGFMYALGSRVNPETGALAIGVLLGVIACIPVALIVLATTCRQQPQERQSQPQNSQMPFIVLTGGAPQQPVQQNPYHVVDGEFDNVPMLPAPKQEIKYTEW